MSFPFMVHVLKKSGIETGFKNGLRVMVMAGDCQNY
jgi:hypothetical protein